MKSPNRDVTYELHAIKSDGPTWMHRVRALARMAVDGGYAAEVNGFHENPNRDTARLAQTASRYRLLVPVSAGIDSTTAWLMAFDAGLDPQPVYVATGADYTRAEWWTVNDLAERVSGAAPTLERWPTAFQKVDYVDPARNLIIIVALANRLRDGGCWGQVWFGNTAEWSETPLVGGDKSHRFFAQTQHLLSLQGYDVHLVSPLVGMTKADCVSWAVAHGYEDEIIATRSCYGNEQGHCGRCRSCWRRYLAFAVNGIDVEWPHGTDWAGHITAFYDEWESNGGGPEWADSRIGAVAAVVEELTQGGVRHGR